MLSANMNKVALLQGPTRTLGRRNLGSFIRRRRRRSRNSQVNASASSSNLKATPKGAAVWVGNSIGNDFKLDDGLLLMNRNNNKRFLSMSPRELAKMEDQVLNALRTVKAGERNVVNAGLIKGLAIDVQKGTLSFEVLADDPQVRHDCEIAIAKANISWLRAAPHVKSRHPKTVNPSTQSKVAEADGLSDVKRIIAVSSCKGGVGKSSTAVNLAASLERLGNSVGVLDADIYGPSLPTMVISEGESWAVTRTNDKKWIDPVEAHGMKCMSYGFVAPGTGGRGKGGKHSITSATKTGAAVLRGPIVSQVITQLATQTDWGKLDYLVVDMPPGTGDIGLTLGQQMKIDGAVIVTTPQRLAFVDVVKGLEMFEKLKVPTIAVVENMAWFDGDDGKRYHPFGPGHKEQLVHGFGIKHSFSLPITTAISDCGDSGIPYVVSNPESETASLYGEIAESVVSGLDELAEKQNNSNTSSAIVKYDEDSGLLIARFITSDDAREYKIKPIDLRRKLRKVDDMLGNSVHDLDVDIRPLQIQKMGNYAVSIVWSDGHDASIYPFEDIKAACEELKNEL